MIRAENLSKYYGSRAAVAGLSFDITEGEVVGLLGLNGAGKTTTLKMLSGALLPTSGRVTIGGADFTSDPDHFRARIGFLPETPPLYGEMRVREFLTFVARLKGRRGPVDALIKDALVSCDLEDRAEDVIDTLSHGYRRRVGIAHAIVHKPPFILLDEPTSGLDPVQVVHMRKLVRSLRKQHTVVVSSHILSEIEQVCDRLLVLHEGKLAAEGTEKDLAAHFTPKTRLHIEVSGTRHALEQCLKGGGLEARLEIERDEGGVVFATVELDEDAPERLAELIVKSGLGLRRLERKELQLESIFLRLTGDSDKSRAAA